MSTKIYNGLVTYPKKTEDLYHLKNKIIKEMYKIYEYKFIEVIEKAYLHFSNSMIKKMSFKISMMDALQLSLDLISEDETIIEEYLDEKKFDEYFNFIYENTLFENKETPQFYNLITLQILIHYISKIMIKKHYGKIQIKNSFVLNEFDMCVYLLPLKNKWLIYTSHVSYLKNNKEKNLYNVIKNIKHVKDYHYQDQTDKPKNISKKEWRQREKDWQKALSNKYTSYDFSNALKIQIQGITSTPFSRMNIFNDEKFLKKIKNTMIANKAIKKIHQNAVNNAVLNSIILENADGYTIMSKINNEHDFYKSFIKTPQKTIENIYQNYVF